MHWIGNWLNIGSGTTLSWLRTTGIALKGLEDVVTIGKDYKWEQHLQNDKDQLEIDTSVGTSRAVIKPRRFKPRKAQSLRNQAKDSNVRLEFLGKPICLEKGIRVCVGLFVERDCRPLLKWTISL